MISPLLSQFDRPHDRDDSIGRRLTVELLVSLVLCPPNSTRRAARTGLRGWM